MKKMLLLFLILVITPVLAFGQEFEDDHGVALFKVQAEGDYAGSAVCMACHGVADVSGAGYNIADAVLNSGHPYKLNKVVDGIAPSYPHTTLPEPPLGLTYSDISYVIGGFGWKARFMDLEGYIITGTEEESGVQYNFESGEWVAYHTGEQKPYTCGSCHLTGWVANEDPTDLTGNQDGLPGIHGTWEEPGIQCEGCHGPSMDHAENPSTVAPAYTEENCSNCHIRNDVTLVDVSGGFIKHHEQYETLTNSGHRELTCVTCHDPHKSTKYELGGFKGMDATCGQCHEDKLNITHNEVTSCIDCHMPEASKSAVAENIYNGDLKTHLFKINTDAVGKEAMFNEDGNLLALDDDGDAFVTLDFACYGCHKDEDGVGGTASMKTLEELSAKAVKVHSGSASAEATYVGASSCIGCHGAADMSGSGYNIAEEVYESGHPYKLNKVVDNTQPVYPTGVVIPTPLDYTWADITYVIGGFGWKARFLDSEGYIITGEVGETTQFNLETQAWAAYHAGEVKPYTCGACHTTGWVANEDPTDLTGNHDGLAGIHGTFVDPGITCEGCHGPGSEHAASMSADDISTSETCANCHIRNDVAVVDASGGFIKHHEQYETKLSAGHQNVNCTACHNPHKSTIRDRGGYFGVEETCATCHETQVETTNHYTADINAMFPTCVDCHMPEASKSAVAENIYNGDIKTHLMKINANAVGKDAMFIEDGSALTIDEDGDSFVTLDFACYSCHKDEDGVGGIMSKRSLAELALKASGMHDVGTGVSTFLTDKSIPSEYKLAQNYPNPFNPSTSIQYSVPQSGNLTLKIYNTTGQLVRTLESGTKSAGNYVSVWNGLNDSGTQVASGVYIYTIQAGSFKNSMKMMFIK